MKTSELIYLYKSNKNTSDKPILKRINISKNHLKEKEELASPHQDVIICCEVYERNKSSAQTILTALKIITVLSPSVRY